MRHSERHTVQGKELQVAKKRVGRYPKEFRRMAVERLKKCDNIVALSRELGVHRRLLYKWREGIYDEIQEVMPLQGSMSVERMCQLAQVSRAGLYRSLQERTPVEEDMELRSAIQQIVLEHRRRYGYRRVSAELRRRGMLANHKRVARIMRADNLLAVQPRQFVVTTDSNHELEVYLNLARRMKLTGIDQLWVADITYIRLRAEFVYLAVILDGFSRKVVGWALE